MGELLLTPASVSDWRWLGPSQEEAAGVGSGDPESTAIFSPVLSRDALRDALSLRSVFAGETLALLL
jgi:hypothetical protein